MALHTSNNPPTSYLWPWLILSLLIHALIIALIFLRFHDLGFKKGTSTNPHAKVAGFKIIGGGEHQSNEKRDSINEQPDPKMQNKSQPTPIQDKQNTITQQHFDFNSLSLYNGSSKSKQNTQNTKSRVKALTKFPSVDKIAQRDIEELYGEEFGDYGFAQQQFIVNNLRDIGRITQRYLQYPASAVRLGQEGVSAVEFYLHPNGDISGLKIIVSSEFMLLDRNSERTIEIAYKDYPRPLTKTKIRIFISYGLSYYGY